MVPALAEEQPAGQRQPSGQRQPWSEQPSVCLAPSRSQAPNARHILLTALSKFLACVRGHLCRPSSRTERPTFEICVRGNAKQQPKQTKTNSTCYVSSLCHPVIKLRWGANQKHQNLNDRTVSKGGPAPTQPSWCSILQIRNGSR